MIVVQTLAELRQARAALPNPLGLVPTMGYLHDGHLSLVRAAQGLSAVSDSSPGRGGPSPSASVAVSIFVNPAQFAPTEDLAAYPRDLARDLDLLERAGVDLVWTPTPEIVYPPGYQTWVTVEEVTRVLEGAVRPAHFRGVTTVVAKLFNAFQPQRAYFGQKDAQQVAVIRRMVQDLDFNLEIITCPIYRASDGLALSSRNVYLTPEQRAAAPVLYHSLRRAAAAYAAGERDPQRLRQLVSEAIAAQPLARVQYISCADAASLQELHAPLAAPALLSLAVYFGNTRLIDNWVLS